MYILLIKITRPNGSLTLEVIFLDYDEITYKIISQKDNNEEIIDKNTYSGRKVFVNNKTHIESCLWEGDCLTPGYDNNMHR